MRTGISAFEALRLLTSTQALSRAADAWQGCAFLSRTVVMEAATQKFFLVLAPNLYAARVWRLHVTGPADHRTFHLDVTLPWEWQVLTDLAAWRALPYNPVVAETYLCSPWQSSAGPCCSGK